jgi:hypothetical protein
MDAKYLKMQQPLATLFGNSINLSEGQMDGIFPQIALYLPSL